MDNYEIISSQHIQAVRLLKQRLGDFVKEAFQDEYNHQGLTIDLLLGRVAETTLSQLERVLQLEACGAQKRSKLAFRDPHILDFVFARYAEFLARHTLRIIATVPPARVDLMPQERLDELLGRLGLKHEAVAQLHAEDDLVVQAWNTARANRRRAMQRFGALYYLASELEGGLSADGKAKLEQEMTNASRYLLGRAADFQTTELKFAVLLGGKALELTRADVARDNFTRETSILQYLNADERLSGYSDGKKRVALYDKIHQYAATQQ